MKRSLHLTLDRQFEGDMTPPGLAPCKPKVANAFDCCGDSLPIEHHITSCDPKDNYAGERPRTVWVCEDNV